MNKIFIRNMECALVAIGKKYFICRHMEFNIEFRSQLVDVCVYCCEGDYCNVAGKWMDTLVEIPPAP